MSRAPHLRFRTPVPYRWAAFAGVVVLVAAPFAVLPWVPAAQHHRQGPVRFAVFLGVAIGAAYVCAAVIRLARRRRAGAAAADASAGG